jgi:hypothetical protein
VLELYFFAKTKGGTLTRLMVAGALVALTLVMVAGIFAFAVFSQALITGAPLGLPG